MEHVGKIVNRKDNQDRTTDLLKTENELKEVKKKYDKLQRAYLNLCVEHRNLSLMYWEKTLDKAEKDLMECSSALFQRSINPSE